MIRSINLKNCHFYFILSTFHWFPPVVGWPHPLVQTMYHCPVGSGLFLVIMAEKCKKYWGSQHHVLRHQSVWHSCQYYSSSFSQCRPNCHAYKCVAIKTAVVFLQKNFPKHSHSYYINSTYSSLIPRTNSGIIKVQLAPNWQEWHIKDSFYCNTL